VKKIKFTIAVLAPHVGEIEPGPSEIATHISGEDFTCYLFNGIKNRYNNKDLHITSTNFDEPQCTEICRNVDIVLAVHGTKDRDDHIYAGGRHESLKQKIIQNLKRDCFYVLEDTTNHSGLDPHNICNKGKLGQGLQIEISNGLRKKMFKGMSRQERQSTTTIFNKFIASIRDVLLEYGSKNNLQS
jgi:phage replication-related protein YjqB (UPF0714/DUF867 family)